jgi:hypothetical protein
MNPAKIKIWGNGARSHRKYEPIKRSASAQPRFGHPISDARWQEQEKGERRRRTHFSDYRSKRTNQTTELSDRDREREREAYVERKKRGGRASISPGLQCGVWLAMAARGRSW